MKMNNRQMANILRRNKWFKNRGFWTRWKEGKPETVAFDFAWKKFTEENPLWEMVYLVEDVEHAQNTKCS